MPLQKIQIIPDLLTLTTEAKVIRCFSFWDNPRFKNFFNLSGKSPFNFKYSVEELSEKIKTGEQQFQFSNLRYKDNTWFYANRKYLMDFKFFLDENGFSLVANKNYHRLFIKIGWLEPIGNILTDYFCYFLEKQGVFYLDGAAAQFNGKTYLFLGFGRNFKTTIVNYIVENGGYYIGEEFFILRGDKVYATIPNNHHFDHRVSYNRLLKNNLSERKVDQAVYDSVIFLCYSDRNEIDKIDIEKANSLINIYHHGINTYYYGFFKARDVFNGQPCQSQKLLSNTSANFYQIHFKHYQSVIDFIKKNNYGQ